MQLTAVLTEAEEGGLIANPPPGMQDLSAVLPTIREVTP